MGKKTHINLNNHSRQGKKDQIKEPKEVFDDSRREKCYENADSKNGTDN